MNVLCCKHCGANSGEGVVVRGVEMCNTRHCGIRKLDFFARTTTTGGGAITNCFGTIHIVNDSIGHINTMIRDVLLGGDGGFGGGKGFL